MDSTLNLIAQIGVICFNLFVVTIFGKHLFAKFENMANDIHDIKTDIAVMKNEQEHLKKGAKSMTTVS